MKKKRIALYGGSFDPIHSGHINLAVSALEQCQLDHLYFIPAALSPFKTTSRPVAPGKDRLAMTTLATKELPNTSVSSFEIEKEGVSYSVETIAYFKEKFPDEQLFYLMEEGTYASFDRWKEYKKILEQCSLLVGKNSLHSKQLSRPKDISGAYFFEMNFLQISSRDIRRKIRERRYFAHLIDRKVLDYIESSALYSI